VNGRGYGVELDAELEAERLELLCCCQEDGLRVVAEWRAGGTEQRKTVRPRAAKRRSRPTLTVGIAAAAAEAVWEAFDGNEIVTSPGATSACSQGIPTVRSHPTAASKTQLVGRPHDMQPI